MENLHTPPDTLVVRNKSLRTNISRVPLAQNNEVPAAAVVTPVFNGPKSRAALIEEGGESFTDIVLYKNPPLSMLVVLAGAVTLSTVHYIISGAHNMTFLSATCYFLLAELALNFARSIFSSNPASGRWQGSSLVAHALDFFSSAANYVASLHDRYLSLEDPALALKVGGCLWTLATVGRYFSPWTLATVGFIATFTIPYAVHTNRDAVEAVTSQFVGIAQAKWAALGLSRKQKAGTLLAVVFFLWLRSSWTNRLIGMLLGTLAVRCNLKPAEVAAIREHAAPLTMSVKKRAARLSVAASDFAHRTLGTKVHFR